MRVALIGVLLVACGASPAPTPMPSASSASASASPGSPAPSGRFVRTLRIKTRRLEPLGKTDHATAKRWASEPQNAKYVLPTFRHILVKPQGAGAEGREKARRKAEELLARLDRGEDFATLAKTSDDPGSAKRGGAYPGRLVKDFVLEMRNAYDALGPGERARKPVESQYGWHIVEKGVVDDEACLDGHLAWIARSAAEGIGRDLTKRLRHVEGSDVRAEVERAFSSALGSGSKLVEKPVVVRMPADTCDGVAMVARGEGISWKEDVLFVASLTNDENDGTEVSTDACEDRSDEMSEADIKALIERSKSQR